MKSKKITKQPEPVKQYDKLLIAQVGLLCLTLFLAPLVAGKLAPVPALIIQLMIFASAGIWLYRSLKSGTIDLPGKSVLYTLAAFWILIIASFVVSVNKGASLRELMNVGAYLLVFMMVVGLKGNRNAVYAVLGSLCLSTLIVGVIGLREYIATASPGWRTFSTFFNPDFLAGFTAMMLPVALAWYLSRVSPGVALISGLCVVLTFTNLLLTGSRLGFIAAIGGLVLFAVLSLVTKSVGKLQIIRLGLLVVPILLVFMLMSTPLKARMGSVEAVKAESHSGGFRIYTWKGTAAMALTNPVLGTGLGTFEDAYPKYATVGYTKLAHNSYLQIAAESGPLSAVVLLLLLGTVLVPSAWNLVKRRSNDTDSNEVASWRGIRWMPDNRMMMVGLISGAAASMARNAVDSDWYITSIGIGFWAIAGLAVSAQSVQIPKNRINAALSILGLASLIAVMSLIGELWFACGESQLYAGNPQDALSYYRIAEKVDPLNADYHRRAGMVLSRMQDNQNGELAEQEFLKTIQLAPSSTKGYYQLGKLYAQLGRDDDSVSMFSKALLNDPNSPHLMLILARQYESMGAKSKALELYGRMIEVENSPYEAIRAMPEIVEPAYVFAHASLGQELERIGDSAGASKLYRTAMTRIENYQKSIHGMGEILEISGSRNPEMEDQVEALRIDLQRRLESLGEKSE
ncbi:MAG: O-antigen ligase family protein [Armatimonadota bacterium]